MYLKLLEKQEQAIPWISRWREIIIKFRVKISDIETKADYKESKKQKVGSLKR
jgi:hypothetical protein